jgi:hypothetical protein
MEGELNCCDCHLHTRHKKRVAARADIKFVPSLCSARQGKYKHSLMLAFSTSQGDSVFFEKEKEEQYMYASSM